MILRRFRRFEPRPFLGGLALFLAIAGLHAAPPPPPVPNFANVPYGPSPHQILDIFLPPGPGPFPVVVWYGTIWVPGKHAPATPFLRHGCAVAAVETRTMTEAKADQVALPVSYVLLDARRALQFIRLHAAAYNLDPNRLATAGGSQGTLPALYVACAGEKADPASSDPVERTSSKVTCVGAWCSQPSIDPRQLQEWSPGIKWGAPALGVGFDESLQKRDQFLPALETWSPDHLVNKDTVPICFGNQWGLTCPPNVKMAEYIVHTPTLALGFQKLAASKGDASVYCSFPGHPPGHGYGDMNDFLFKQLGAQPQTATKP